MCKKAICIILLFVLCMLTGLWLFYYTDDLHHIEIVYPLEKMKNDGSQWRISVGEVGSEQVFLVVSDQKKLLENKKKFKIEFLHEVYWSTPNYMVKVFKNEKQINSYPIFDLKQIDFGLMNLENR